jgi:hypothetical protein
MRPFTIVGSAGVGRTAAESGITTRFIVRYTATP